MSTDIQSIRSTAKQYMGFIFKEESDSKSQSLRIGQKILEDFSDDDIVVRNEKSVYEAEIKGSIKKCEKFVKRALDIHASVPLGAAIEVDLSGNAKSDGSKSTSHRLESYLCAVVCLKVNKCSFKNFSKLKLIPGNYSYSTSIITSGTCYVGYMILMEIFTQTISDNVNNSVSLSSDISLQKFVSFGFKADKVDKNLKSKVITHVNINKIQEIGNYRVPQVSFSEINNNARFLDVLETVRKDFNDEYAGCSRIFYIDEVDDLSSYAAFSISPVIKHHQLEILDSNSQNSVDDVSENGLQFFSSLEFEIKNSLDNKNFLEYVNSLLVDEDGNSINLSQMFFNISLIFSNQFAHMPEKIDKPYTIVLGPIGNGKSLLVGSLLGHKIEGMRVPIGDTGKSKPVYDYKDQANNNDNRPVIGHIESQTKGIEVYNTYIDSSGFSDTSGLTADICNAVAMQIGINYYHPQKVIVVLPSSYLENNRASEFIKLVKTLSKTINDPVRKEILSNILFVINDKKAKVTVDDVETYLLDAINVLKSERNKLIDKNEYKNLIEKVSWNDLNEILRSSFDKLSEDTNYKSIEVLQEKIEFINKIDSNKNIIIADFSNNEATAGKILNWISKNKEGRIDDINMCNLYPGCKIKFSAACSAAKTYFDFLEKQKALYKNELKEIMKSIENFSNLEKDSSKIKKAELVKTFTKNKEDLEQDLAKLQKKEKISQSLIESLSKGDIPMEWPELLAPEIPITPRYPWAISDNLATKYKFKCSKNIPELIKCEYIRMDIESPGTFSVPTKKFLEDREVEYTPAWWGREKNCMTKIRLFVKAKDHLYTKQKIQKITNDLENIKSEIRGLQISIARYSRWVEGLNNQIKLDGEKELLISTQKNIEKKYMSVSEKLKKFDKFNSLLKKIDPYLINK